MDQTQHQNTITQFTTRRYTISSSLRLSLSSIAITGLLALQGLIPASAQSNPAYTERTLGSGGYTSAVGNGISSSGSVLVGTGTTGSASGALYWSASSTTATVLPSGGGTSNSATATDGTSIVGLSTTGTTANVVVWSGTNFATVTTVNVPFPSYSNLDVSGISGSVISGAALSNGTEDGYCYNFATSTAYLLNPSSSTGAEVLGVTGNVAIGEATISGVNKAGVWTSVTSGSTSFVNIGSDLSTSIYGASLADAITSGSTNLIVGSATKLAGGNVAVAWSGSGSTYTATVLNSTGYTSTYALATNGNYIVGYGVNAAGSDVALLWTTDNSTTSPIALSTYGIPSVGLNSEATGVDIKGDIVGMANGQAFELTSATPEPGSIALTLLGALGTFSMTRGRRTRHKAVED